MKVDAGASYPFASQRSHAPARANTQDFASLLAQGAAEAQKTTSSPTESSRPDFTSMTRQELFDWMNGQIRSGDMTLDESGAFLGMTVKISVATGQPVEMATDATRIDFTEKARQGIEFALSRFDYAAAERLQNALGTMLRSQRVDIRI
ncbi:MAG: hypothetical protein AB7G35_01125 [Hyphomicrobiaceae bacterium]